MNADVDDRSAARLPDPNEAGVWGVGVFATTHWSIVQQAGTSSTAESTAALDRLCRQYWEPLFVFARRRGYRDHDAQDVVQGFFARLLEKGSICAANRDRGRFRTFLLSAFCHYLANERRDQSTQKRGGTHPHASLEEDSESEGARQVTDGMTPERHYERSWAFALLERVVERLREEYAQAGRLPLFLAIQPCITGEADRLGYARLGEALGMSESTVAVAVHRMRRRYGEFVREEIAATVSTPEEAEDELRHLIQMVSDVAPRT